jgi:ribosome-associated toxin RatA of RatAB toxin-antitoxin module
VKPIKIIFFTFFFSISLTPLYAKKKERTISYNVVELKDDTYEINTYLRMQAPEELLWQAISEYERTPEFVHSIKSSTIVSPKDKDNKIVVEMKCAGVVIFIPIHVRLLLNMIENQELKKIDFVESSAEDFIIFEGFWQVTKSEDKSVLQLSLKAKPKHTYFGATRRIVDYSIKALFVDIENRVKKMQQQTPLVLPQKQETPTTNIPLPPAPAVNSSKKT